MDKGNVYYLWIVLIYNLFNNLNGVWKEYNFLIIFF